MQLKGWRCGTTTIVDIRRQKVNFCTSKKSFCHVTLSQVTAIVNIALTQWREASCYAFCFRLAICR